MAIFYALASPELTVVGLTTIFGNHTVEVCTTNALRLLEIAERSDVPVARGAARPLAAPYAGPAEHVHGRDGQGNTSLPPPTLAPTGADASRFIIDTVMTAPGEITLVPLGPLTNIAIALITEPALARNLAGIVLMGGAAFVSGNASPAAEANILNDPEAADIVFGADCPLVMCGLDVTEQIVLPRTALDSLTSATNARAHHVRAITAFYVDFHREQNGLDGIYVHDSTTISYLLAPQLFTTVHHPIRVDCGHSFARGRTVAAARPSGDESAWSGRRDVTICTDVDAAAVIELEMGRLTAPSSTATR